MNAREDLYQLLLLLGELERLLHPLDDGGFGEFTIEPLFPPTLPEEHEEDNARGLGPRRAHPRSGATSATRPAGSGAPPTPPGRPTRGVVSSPSRIIAGPPPRTPMILARPSARHAVAAPPGAITGRDLDRPRVNEARLQAPWAAPAPEVTARPTPVGAPVPEPKPRRAEPRLADAPPERTAEPSRHTAPPPAAPMRLAPPSLPEAPRRPVALRPASPLAHPAPRPKLLPKLSAAPSITGPPGNLPPTPRPRLATPARARTHAHPRPHAEAHGPPPTSRRPSGTRAPTPWPEPRRRDRHDGRPDPEAPGATPTPSVGPTPIPVPAPTSFETFEEDLLEAPVRGGVGTRHSWSLSAERAHALSSTLSGALLDRAARRWR